MNVLWITNSPFPEVYEKLGMKAPVTVGWVYSAANGLLEQYENLSFAIASFYDGKQLTELEIKGITHFLIPKRLKYKLKSKDEQYWHEVKKRFRPDVIHIHGSEYLHSYSFVKACGPNKVVLSIQGLVSIYERYYLGNIRRKDLIKSITLRDIARYDTIFLRHKTMQNRGFIEKLLIKNINHIIGRTHWDRYNTWAINPNSTYHFCNETLRPSFYQNKWSIENCEAHSIFISQAQYPIKGFHQIAKALSIVLKHYPNTKVYVAGKNYFSNQGIRLSGFGKYINSLIKKYDISGHIFFTGFLNEEEMCQRFLDSHISICPSAIENSPNSVGEAQILGVPCIASFVGGIADMIEHGETGLIYRFEEYEMLAAHICKLFSDDKLALRISTNSKVVASTRHNKAQNAIDLYKIYSKISNESQ